MNNVIRWAGCECVVQRHRYGNGRRAIRLVDANDGVPMATATVNLPCVELAPDEALIKDYGTNEGVLDALVTAGLVKPAGHVVKVGFVEVHVVRLSFTREPADNG